MTISELIAKLSEFDGSMKVVITRYHGENDVDGEDISYTAAYPVDSIEVSDSIVDCGLAENVHPFVEIALGDEIFSGCELDRMINSSSSPSLSTR